MGNLVVICVQSCQGIVIAHYRIVVSSTFKPLAVALLFLAQVIILIVAARLITTATILVFKYDCLLGLVNCPSQRVIRRYVELVHILC